MTEIYGTEEGKDIPEEYSGVSKLRETTFVVSIGELEILAEFFNSCYSEYKEDKDWDHKHFVDFAHKYGYTGPDIIVYADKSV